MTYEQATAELKELPADQKQKVDDAAELIRTQLLFPLANMDPKILKLGLVLYCEMMLKRRL